MQIKRQHSTHIALIAALCALVTLPRVIEVGTFVAFDETFYWERANRFFVALLQHDWPGTIVDPRPAVVNMWVQALGLSVKYLLPKLLFGQPEDVLHLMELERPFTFSLLGEKRLAMALTNSAAILLLCWSVKRLLGPKVALVATILLALNPFLLSDSRTMRGDALMSALMSLSVVWFLLYLREGRWLCLVLSGFFEGLAALIKVAAYPVAAFVLLALGAYIFSRPAAGRKGQLWRGLLALALLGATTLAVFWLLWPAMWVVPDRALGAIFAFAEDLADGRKTYFLGHVYTGELLPFYYVFDFFLRSTPLAFIGFVVVLYRLALILYRAWQGRSRLQTAKSPTGVGSYENSPTNLYAPWWQRIVAQAHLLGEPRIVTATIALTAYVFVFGAIMTVGALRRDHYFMPGFVAIDIVAAVGLLWLGGVIWERWASPLLARKYRQEIGAQTVFAGGLVLTLFLQGAVSLPHHPYYYTYWNPLFGDGYVAPRIFMIAWGQDLAEAAQYLNAKPDAENLKVASVADLEFEPVFVGERLKIDTSGAWVQADYVLIRLRHLQLLKHKQTFLDYLRRREPERIVHRFGIDYIWIYPGLAVEHYTGGAYLAGEARLFGYKLDPETPEAGSEVAIWLVWQKEDERRSEMYLRLVDAGGYEWARADVNPLPGFELAAQTDDAFVESLARLKIPVGTPPGSYFLKVGVYSLERGEVAGEFTLPPGQDSIRVQKPALPLPASAVEMQHRLEKPLNEAVELLGYDFAGKGGREFALVLYWRALQDLGDDYVVAVRLLDAGGQEVDYWLGRPVRSGYPTGEWSEGEIVKDPWDLTAGEKVAGGQYTLEVELFDAATGESAGKLPLGQVALDF